MQKTEDRRQKTEGGIEDRQSKIQNPKSKIPTVVQQVLAQYRRRLAVRTVVTAAFGLGFLAALLWRLSQTHLGRVGLGGIGCVGIAALVVWQWLAVRRDRLVRSQAVLQLDRTLGLKARLLTAVEFANVANPPLLYPRLVEDTAQTLPVSLKHAPRVMDRWTFALSVMLLLLLLWPKSAPSLRQLAMQPPLTVPPTTPPTPPSQPPPPQNQPQSSRDQQRSNSGSQQERSQGGQGSQGEQSHSSSGQSAPSSAAEQSGGQSTTQPSRANQGQGNPQSSKSPQGSSGQGQQQNNQAHTQHTPSAQANSQPSKNSQQQARDSTGRSTPTASSQTGSSGGQQQKPAGGSSSKEGSAQVREGAGKEQSLQQLAKLTQGSAAQPGSSAGQELLKADIQQLLKEMSGELKQLQAQLEADAKRSDQPNPAPGTSTDTQLYDAASQLEKAAGNRLPIQLDVDTQATATKRRGSGVGEPSKEIADALPQQQPEHATLAEQGTAEEGVARQAIPPEYRPVFERLSSHDERTPTSTSR